MSHYSNSQELSYPSSIHMYPGPMSNVVNMQPRTQLSSAFFIPNEMRNEILARNELANMIDHTQNADIPNEIDNYHSLVLLENHAILHQKLPLPSSTYKATHITTGTKYCLRRLHGKYRIDYFMILFLNPQLKIYFWFRLSNTIDKMHECRWIVEKISTLKCGSVARNFYHKKFRWPM